MALPIPGDFRAWDALVRGRDWRCGVEAETRPRDLQALERRLALKQRDGDVDCLVLLLGDTRHNRALVRGYADALHEQFPAPGQQTLERLAHGAAPAANSIVLLYLGRVPLSHIAALGGCDRHDWRLSSCAQGTF